MGWHCGLVGWLGGLGGWWLVVFAWVAFVGVAVAGCGSLRLYAVVWLLFMSAEVHDFLYRTVLDNMRVWYVCVWICVSSREGMRVSGSSVRERMGACMHSLISKRASQ